MELTSAEQMLGKLAETYASQLRSQGWQQMVTEARGTSNISATVGRLPHTAARLLSHLRKRGASVPMMTPPWSADRKSAAIRRGPHKSSQSERAFVAEEMLDFCRQGYWIVLPLAAVEAWPNLRISPLGVVPQQDRRPRLIVDYSFSDVNADTLSLAPKEAMQFGRALQRVISTIVQADRCFGPVHLSKIDIADGFYRVWLQITDIPKLGVALPLASECHPLVAFPLALPMGWVESPPYFTALTETACDLANAALRVAPPVAAVDVYVDDFLLMAQTAHQQRKVLRATLQAVDAVFRPLDATDPAHRKEPASVKKMLKGDAHWAT
ncbi:hypothetical protein MHU86_12629 [Fragilaria crotonensis]|nr:hypothetical protein MHU86_12629 [Fragilaria crotonensis]